MLWTSKSTVTARYTDWSSHGQLRATERSCIFLIREKPIVIQTDGLRFLEVHPQASSNPDIQTCRVFVEWIGMGIVCRLEKRPTVKTMLGIFRQNSGRALEGNPARLLPSNCSKARMAVGGSSPAKSQDYPPELLRRGAILAHLGRDQGS
ncbi:Zinc finger C2H2 [Penicillium verhagenii]|nr:Zinc finger C2H2 [Penicillium verhagenii]